MRGRSGDPRPLVLCKSHAAKGARPSVKKREVILKIEDTSIEGPRLK